MPKKAKEPTMIKPDGVDTNGNGTEGSPEIKLAGKEKTWGWKYFLGICFVIVISVVGYLIYQSVADKPKSGSPSPPPSGTDVHTDLSSTGDLQSDSEETVHNRAHSGGGSSQMFTPGITNPLPPAPPQLPPPPPAPPAPPAVPAVPAVPPAVPAVPDPVISAGFDYDNCNSSLGVTSIPAAAQCDTGEMSDMARMAHYWDTQMTQCEGGECSGLTYSDVFNIYTNPGPGRCPTGSAAFALYQSHADGCSDDMTPDTSAPCNIPDAANFDNTRCCNLLKEYEWDEFDLSRQTAGATSSIFGLATACNSSLPPGCNLESISQPNFNTLKECVPLDTDPANPPPSGTSLTPACASRSHELCGPARKANKGNCQLCMTGHSASLLSACNIQNAAEATAINDLYCSEPPQNNPLLPTISPITINPTPPSGTDPAPCFALIGTLHEKCCPDDACDEDGIPNTCTIPCSLKINEFFSLGCPSLMGLHNAELDQFNTLHDKCQAVSSTPPPLPTGSLGGLCDCKGDKEGPTLCQEKLGVLRRRTFCTDKNTPEECAAVNSTYPNLCEWTPSLI